MVLVSWVCIAQWVAWFTPPRSDLNNGMQCIHKQRPTVAALRRCQRFWFQLSLFTASPSENNSKWNQIAFEFNVEVFKTKNCTFYHPYVNSIIVQFRLIWKGYGVTDNVYFVTPECNKVHVLSWILEWQMYLVSYESSAIFINSL